MINAQSLHIPNVATLSQGEYSSLRGGGGGGPVSTSGRDCSIHPAKNPRRLSPLEFIGLGFHSKSPRTSIV